MTTSFEPIIAPHLSISGGEIKDVAHFAQFGYNADLSSGVEATVWNGPTPMYIFPSDTGEVMEIVSDNAADVGMVIGAQALDQDWNEVTVVVALNGTTPVAIPGTLARINRAINVGPTEFAGQVDIRAAGGGTVYAVMLADDQITTQVVFSVPAGYKALLRTALVTLNKSGGTSVSTIFKYVRRNFGGVFATGARFGLQKGGSSSQSIEVENVAPLDPCSDVMLTALADANNTDASARTPLLLYKV